MSRFNNPQDYRLHHQPRGPRPMPAAGAPTNVPRFRAVQPMMVPRQPNRHAINNARPPRYTNQPDMQGQTGMRAPIRQPSPHAFNNAHPPRYTNQPDGRVVQSPPKENIMNRRGAQVPEHRMTGPLPPQGPVQYTPRQQFPLPPPIYPAQNAPQLPRSPLPMAPTPSLNLPPMGHHPSPRQPHPLGATNESGVSQGTLALYDEGEVVMTDLYRSILREDFFHPINRRTAEELLRAVQGDSMFLFRPSKKENPITLCIIKEGVPIHIPIRQRVDGKFALGKKEKETELAFTTIANMRNHYMFEPIELEDGSTFLLKSTPHKDIYMGSR